MSEEILRMEGITKAYELGEETFLALKGVDLTVDRGEPVISFRGNIQTTDDVHQRGFSGS